MQEKAMELCRLHCWRQLCGTCGRCLWSSPWHQLCPRLWQAAEHRELFQTLQPLLWPSAGQGRIIHELGQPQQGAAASFLQQRQEEGSKAGDLLCSSKSCRSGGEQDAGCGQERQGNRAHTMGTRPWLSILFINYVLSHNAGNISCAEFFLFPDTKRVFQIISVEKHQVVPGSKHSEPHLQPKLTP